MHITVMNESAICDVTDLFRVMLAKYVRVL